MLNLKKGALDYHLFFGIFLYIFLLGIGLAKHEFWMDESHHWLIARDSDSLLELFQNYQYDGHPMLWVFCLWVLACFTSNVIFVQIFHAIIAVCTVGLLLFKAPFKKRYRILFIFGYYPLFEYGILSRNYALTLFFLLLFCVYYEKNKALWMPFFLLGLASNSHLFGFIFSVFLVVKIVYEERANLRKHWSAIGLFLFMAILAIVSIKAPSDHFFYFDFARLFNSNTLGSVLSMWWKAICPIPDWTTANFWNTNFLTRNYKVFASVLVILTWLLPLFVLQRKSFYYIVFYGYAASLMVFCLLTGLNISQRIGGFLLFALVVLVWLEQKECQERRAIITINAMLKKAGIYFFLLVQLFSAGVFWVAEVQRPFSNTKNIYHFLAANIDERTVVYAGLYCNYIGINNYGDLNLYISSQGKLNYCDWRTLKTNQGKSYWEEAVGLMASGQYKRVIVLRTEKVMDFTFANYEIQLLGQFEDGLVKNENAYVYSIQRNRQ